jgi:uncharacterized membrane protein YkvA (DUF1232 family)
VGLLEVGRMWARRIKRDATTLWFAKSHPRTPWHAKALGLFVVAYALSPIDLVPDFIPVLGYVDDVVLLPALNWMTVRMLPAEVLLECRQQADDWMAKTGQKPRSVTGGLVVVSIWIVVVMSLLWWLHALFDQ